ncbi:BspA family leucine-rich repeat surface protein [Streptobacillus felis]|uniref:BspA family leucine-rich repeat surface protein n=1 Tax=Streptobacillus felis TaxID=1384509 RepID=A0A7Z0PES9_9FUSO|nr:BspA family leucine-rich repeat surface protein [Streptobacillus felis]NYV27939.1 BspA family leucine-rich repeat surface protein [Streptobacillus felis]
MKIKINKKFLFLMLISSFAFSNYIEINNEKINYDLRHESINLSSTDIGEVANSVSIVFNENEKTYEISGAGKINKQKFREYIKTIENTSEYTLVIKDSTIMFPDDSSSLFSNLWLNIVIPDNIDTSNVTNMSKMFYLCFNMNPNTEHWDTSNVTDMSYMFYETRNSQAIIKNWDTSKVKNMSNMFWGSRNENLDITNWNVENVTNIDDIFRDSFLENLKIFDTDFPLISIEKYKKEIFSLFIETMLDNITYYQKLEIKEKIKGITDKKDLRDYKQTLLQLNEKMTEFIQKTEELKRKYNNQKEKIDYDDRIVFEEFISKMNSVGILEISEINKLIDYMNEKIDFIDQLLSDNSDKRNNVKKLVNNLNEISEKQKELMLEELENENNNSVIEALKQKYLNINEYMARIKELKSKIEELVSKKDIPLYKLQKVEKFFEEINASNNIIYENVISDLIYDLSRLHSELFSYKDKDKNIEIDLNKYIKFIDAFTYTNTDISNSFNEKIFFNINLIKSFKEISEELINDNKFDGLGLIANLNLGFNLNVNKDIKVGGFLEYQRSIANHISIGTSFNHNDGNAFIRYRLAEYNGIINHNLDLYGKYNKKINLIKNLDITPSVGILITYSSKTMLDEYVEYNHRIGVIADVESKIDYLISGINIYVNPFIKFGYNNGKIVEMNNSENFVQRGKDYFVYGLKTGLKKEFFNGVILKTEVGFRGNEKGMFRVKSNLGVGYNW